MIALQPPLGQRPQHGQLFGQPRPAPHVTPREHFAQERLIGCSAGEIATAPQQQRLLDRFLKVPMRRLAVAVLMRAAGVGPRSLQAIVLQKPRVPRMKLAPVREVVHRRAQPVSAMPPGNAREFPQRVLQTFAERFQALRQTNRRRLPVRVGQHRVVHQMVERLTGDGHAQLVHVREVR